MDDNAKTIKNEEANINNNLINIHKCEPLYNLTLNCIKENYEEDTNLKNCKVILIHIKIKDKFEKLGECIYDSMKKNELK